MMRLRRVIPVALAISMASAPAALAAEQTPGPGLKYDSATLARIQDNVLEYGEIELLMEEYNPALKSMRESYRDSKDSYKSVDKLKQQIDSGAGDLRERAQELGRLSSTFKDLLGKQSTVTPTDYANMVYSSELLGQQADQMALSADNLTETTPDMLKLKMIDTTKASLVSGVQQVMIGYQQALLQKESLEDSRALLQTVYESTQLQARSGMVTESAVLAAKENLVSAEGGILAIDTSLDTLRRSLCTMLGWEYSAAPEIRPVPGADLAGIERMNPEADRQAAIENNLTLRYNLLDLANKTEGSVEQQNLMRTIDQQKEQAASQLVNLYNAVIQKKNEYDTAVSGFNLEKTKMDTAQRKWDLQMLSKLEYLQQKNAYKAKEIAVKNADLALFQAMETYDWAVKGNMSLS